MHQDRRIQRLVDALARRAAFQVPDSPRVARAAVALVVRPQPVDLEVLLIQRAPRTGDPWSGHMALPGGRQDPGDPDPLTTAMRETLEEVDINLRSKGWLLGALDQIEPQSASLPQLVISPFSFAVEAGTTATANHEVAATMWIPLRELAAAGARSEIPYTLPDGGALRLPALQWHGRVIWGLTYRILIQFLGLSGATGEEGG